MMKSAGSRMCIIPPFKKYSSSYQTLLKNKKALRRAELEITIAQINPHFLYNTLNTINSLARNGQDGRGFPRTIKGAGRLLQKAA